MKKQLSDRKAIDPNSVRIQLAPMVEEASLGSTMGAST